MMGRSASDRIVHNGNILIGICMGVGTGHFSHQPVVLLASSVPTRQLTLALLQCSRTHGGLSVRNNPVVGLSPAETLVQPSAW